MLNWLLDLVNGHPKTVAIMAAPLAAWFTTLLWWIGSAILSAFIQKLLAPKPDGPDKTPYEIQDVAAGTPIPFFFGSQRCRPVITWMGPITTGKVMRDGALLGYDHGITAMAVLGWGTAYGQGITNMIYEDDQAMSRLPDRVGYDQIPHPDVPTQQGPFWGAFVQVFFDPYTEVLHGGMERIHIYLPNVYGDRDGVQGYINMYQGVTEQGVDSVMAAKLSGYNVPRYPRLVYVVYDNFGFGLSPSPRPIDYVWSSSPSQENPAGFMMVRVIDDDSASAAAGFRPWDVFEWNPVAVIWECMCNRLVGGTIDPNEIDADNFASVASATSQDTPFGIGKYGVAAVLANQQGAAQEVINQCLKVLDGVLIRDTDTNKYKIKLARNAANNLTEFLALPSLDEASISSMKWTRREWSETYNEVVATFPNAALLFNQDTVTARNNASISETGLRSLRLDLPIVTNPELALRIAERELKANSRPLGKGTLQCTRVVYGLEQGDVIRVSYAEYGLVDVLCRIQTINIGTGLSAKMTLEVVEDVYTSDSFPAGEVHLPPPVLNTTYRIPSVDDVQKSLVGTATGRAAVTISDPQKRLYEVAYRARSRETDAWSAWIVVATSTPNTSNVEFPFGNDVTNAILAGTYNFDVTLAYDGNAAIQYRFRYVSDKGTAAVPDNEFGEITNEVDFQGLSAQPQIQWANELDITNGKVRVTFYGLNVPHFTSTVLTGYNLKRFEVWLDSNSPDSFDIEEGHTVPPALAGPPWITDWLDTTIGGPIQQGVTAILHIKVVADYNGSEVYFYDNVTLQRPPAQQATALFQMENNATAIATGGQCFLTFQYDCKIVGWRMQSLEAATVRFNLWKNNSSSVLPTVADSLGLNFGSGSNVQIEEGTFSPEISVSAGDNIVLEILSNNNSQHLTLALHVVKDPLVGDP